MALCKRFLWGPEPAQPRGSCSSIRARRRPSLLHCSSPGRDTGRETGVMARSQAGGEEEKDGKGFCREAAAGSRAGPGSGWVMLKAGDGGESGERVPVSAAACPGTHSLWLPLPSPAPSSARRGRGARAFTGLEKLFGEVWGSPRCRAGGRGGREMGTQPLRCIPLPVLPLRRGAEGAALSKSGVNLPG